MSVKEARHHPELGSHKINGNAVIAGMPTSHLIGGYALTRGVPRELWENWYSFFKDSPLVKSRSVFAHQRRPEVVAEARANRKTRSGLERIDPDKPHQFVRGIKREKTKQEIDAEDGEYEEGEDA